jgi:Tfp pilus assembly protein PilZ
MLLTEDCGMPIIKPFGSRIKVATTVHYEPCHGMSLSGISDDLSVGGLYLRTNLLLDLNEKIKVTFPLPGQEKAVSCEASVAWTNFAVNQRKPETPNGVGLQFEDLSLDNLIALSTFVDHHNKETTITTPSI